MSMKLEVGCDKRPTEATQGTLAMYWRSEHGLHMDWVLISEITPEASRATMITHVYELLRDHEALVRQTLLEGLEIVQSESVLDAASPDELLVISDRIAERQKSLHNVHIPWIERNAIVVNLPQMSSEQCLATLAAMNAALMAMGDVRVDSPEPTS